jgi:rhodanese-related sulfurtransferase
MSAAPGVATIGELELIDFVKKEVKNGSGILVDARMPKFFNSETIPGAVNIPFILFTGDETASKIINLLGVKTDKETYDFTEAKDLCLFCNGPWCDQSPRAIKALIKIGYPADKLKYYRGGMQLWKSFSLTTVLPLANTVEGKKNDG